LLGPIRGDGVRSDTELSRRRGGVRRCEISYRNTNDL